MADEIAFENGRNSNFEGLVTLTLTLDPVIRHTVVHHSSTSRPTYIPNFIQIEETFCGRTDGRKNGLEDSELKNFRSVSNLSFMSKLLEKIVQTRIQAFFDSNGLMAKMQSAYRRFHITETAVTKVFSDLLVAADNGKMSALCVLDLTAAFDTVDHDLLLLWLERQSGLRGIVLAWLRSYLSRRTFRVLYNSCASFVVYIVCSVPQGSVLGPLLFIVYTADLAAVAQKHNVTVYASALQS